MAIPTDFVNLTDLPESEYLDDWAVAVESSDPAQESRHMPLSKITKKMRTDSVSQLGLVYDRDWFAGIVIDDGGLTAKKAIWHNGQFYSINTDTGFTSNDFDTDFASDKFVKIAIPALGNADSFSSIEKYADYMQEKRVMINTKTQLNAVNPWMYGAKGNGADDTLALQKCFLRSGEIRLDDEFCYSGILLPTNHVEVCGVGILKSLSPNAQIFVTNVQDVKLSGFELNGNMSAYTAGTGGFDRGVYVGDGARDVYLNAIRSHDFYFAGVYVGGGPGITPPVNIHHNSCKSYDIGSPLDTLHPDRGNGFVCSAGLKVYYDFCEALRIHGVGGFNAEGTNLLREDLIYSNCISDTITHTQVMPPSAHGFRFNDTNPVAQGNKSLQYINCTSRNTAGDNYLVSDVAEVLFDTCRGYDAGRINFNINNTVGLAGDITLDGCKGERYKYKGLTITGGKDITVSSHKQIGGLAGSLECYQIIKDANTKSLSFVGNLARSIQTHALSINVNDFNIDDFNVIDIGLKNDGDKYYGVTTPAGAAAPINNRGIIDNLSINNSSPLTSAKAAIYAQGDRFRNVTLGKINNGNGIDKVDYGTSKTYQMLNGPYPAKPDLGGVGSEATWKIGDNVAIDTAVNSGDPTEAQCVIAGSPGVWKYKNPLM